MPGGLSSWLYLMWEFVRSQNYETGQFIIPRLSQISMSASLLPALTMRGSHGTHSSKLSTGRDSRDSARDRSQSGNQVFKSGYLQRKESATIGHNWKKRWCVLQGDKLTLYKSEQDVETGKKGSFHDLRSYRVFETDPKGFSLQPVDEKDKIERIFLRSEEPLKACKRATQPSGIEIPAVDLKLGELLGRGASGNVHRGVWQGDTVVAVKMMMSVEDEEQRESFYQEMQILSSLRHPEVVTMYGYSFKEERLCLVTELVDGGNLAELIVQRDRVLEDHHILEIAMGICRGMNYLHDQGVQHRDLKPANVLVITDSRSDSINVRICDFGLSASSFSTSSAVFGTPAYAAPELSDPNHTGAVDVFSFGLILWELYSREVVWAGIQFSTEISQKISAGIRPPVDGTWLLGQLMQDCWQGDPECRPPFSEIKLKLNTIVDTVKLLRTRTQSLTASPPSSSNYSTGGFNFNGGGPNFNPPGSPNFNPTGSLNFNPPGSPKFNPTGSLNFNSSQASPASSQSIEDRISARFQGGQMLWPQFAEALRETMGAQPLELDALGDFLAEGGKVQYSTWVKFIQWFSPLSHSQDPTPPPTSFSPTEIRDIVGPKYFHGFLSAEQTSKTLSSGQFLIRFSSHPGHYTVSTCNGSVYHMRLAMTKNGRETNFIFEGQEYPSLKKVVEDYSTKNLPEKQFTLGRPCLRAAQLDYMSASGYI
ncbi:hypothetical protein PROFUN_12310 [Planoprotostelium fungivorum]|uniref:SH2 domain-containing protein n=1 Tax=Planoprotostelium fungivorum TaxID=1890364 RepID=A0A2P6N7U7_9EUKA|nr:hypothetical protein PROFUN_12310 [Planoprotostelium fungivorum]